MTKSAVLIPIIDHPHEPSVLFILRSHKVSHHKGQVSFPGGCSSGTDLSIEKTALRETEEEIGLESSKIKVVHQLQPIDTATGFNITPFVGIISPQDKFNICPNEVKEVFEVPISFLANKGNIQEIQINPNTNAYTVIKYERFTIWGATAKIAAMLIESLPEYANELAMENITQV